MKSRVILLVPALVALVAGLLVSSPAEAAVTTTIAGTVAGPGGAGNVGAVRVELLSIDRGGNTHVRRFANDIPDGGTYRFTVPLRRNKSVTEVYYLRVVGPDVGGDSQSWFWRGRDGAATTGGRYLRDASRVEAKRNNEFTADFRYSSISGTAPAGTRLTIAAAPPSYRGGTKARRELDVAGCANIFATATSNGAYRINFLPYAPGDQRYMVAARLGGDERWNNSFGSCFDVQDYAYSRANMLALPVNGLNYPVAVAPSGNDLTVAGAFKGFGATSQGDRWVSLREVEPKAAILDSPIVAQTQLTSGGTAVFSNIAPGRYYVELGRRTGCADWYPSRFTNNRTYFKGLDRASEKWKSFSVLSKLQGGKNSGYEGIARRAQPNPATDAEQGKRAAGYAGWMYRTHCKALGAGGYKTIDVAGFGSKRRVSVTVGKGAVVKGHISRAAGRTNKEMMVTLTSSDGKRVLRTDLTDGRGNFYVAGLPSGNWKITVNADSWRGIGRAYTGRHFIRVRAGRVYNAGNLKFKD